MMTCCSAIACSYSRSRRCRENLGLVRASVRSPVELQLRQQAEMTLSYSSCGSREPGEGGAEVWTGGCLSRRLGAALRS
jgi:hypothetical protein